MNNRNKIKRMFGAAIKIVIAVTVFIFLGMKSIDFFLFTTPADKWFYAYLGFGLTGGGVIGYLIIFLWDADTDLKKMVAMVMLAVCILGELATAGFGLQIDTWQKTGISMTEGDFQAMVLAVQLLGFAHAAALVTYVAGDKIQDAFKDDDGDGIPNAFDRHDNRKDKPLQVTRAFSADAEIAKLREKLAEYEKNAPKDDSQQKKT